MNSAWRIQSARDELGTIRTSPHHIEQTCASFGGVRTAGEVVTVAAVSGATEAELNLAFPSERTPPRSKQYLESPVASDLVVTY